jgi:hypothetical protein
MRQGKIKSIPSFLMISQKVVIATMSFRPAGEILIVHGVKEQDFSHSFEMTAFWDFCQFVIFAYNQDCRQKIERWQAW